MASGSRARYPILPASNRNFEGRQGKGARTHLMSPAMAAAAAVTGKITDVRKLLVTPGGAFAPMARGPRS